ncbi:MAG TPA: hypothetical protein VFB38_27575 [Chthonomonadaceae bacterium]|nr:hypothetical protein [Chthonomonadaceae bacterium]
MRAKREYSAGLKADTVTDIRRLLAKVAAQEAQFRETTFLAPCVRGGKVRARIMGLVQTFTPHPPEFEGWGLFRPAEGKTAQVVEEADLPLVAEYLRRLLPLRVRLAYRLKSQTWLAYPANEGDARQRIDAARPFPVHLVMEGQRFEQAVVRGDGQAWWFEEIDRRADPQIADRLREALKQVTLPEALRFKGLTPEMRTAYDLAAQQAAEFAALMQPRRDEARLRRALEMAGGALREFDDRGDYWLVDWTTRDGQQHRSAIGKRDLAVISSGICLSGEDRKFDLQSLVGVMQGQFEGNWDE